MLVRAMLACGLSAVPRVVGCLGERVQVQQAWLFTRFLRRRMDDTARRRCCRKQGVMRGVGVARRTGLMWFESAVVQAAHHASEG